MLSRRHLAAAALAIAAGLALPGAGQAHHSFAMFDSNKTITLKGTVKELQWSNPHVVLWVLTEPEGAAGPDLWSVELTSPGNLTRQGWTRLEFKPGDKVAVEVNPLRDGSHGGGFKQITNLATGKVLAGGRAG